MRSILMTLAAALVALPAAGQLKVAVIDLQRAVLATSEIKKAQTDLEARFKVRSEELQRLEKELQSIKTQLETMAGKLRPEAEAELNAQGQRKQREYQRKAEDLQADVDRERNEILQKSGRQMTEVVKKLAEEKTLDVIVDKSNTLFSRDTLDITNDVVAAYDKAYPAVSVAPPSPPSPAK